MITSIYRHLQQILTDTLNVTLTLFKILIPALIAVRLLDQFGLIAELGALLSPFMEAIGLPAFAGLIWATTLVTNIYAGLVVFVSYSSDWTLEQVTLLGVLMLGAHNLIVELGVAAKAGCRVIPQLLMRVLGAYALAWLLHQYYQTQPEMQASVALLWQPELQGSDWLTWAQNQILGLCGTALIILGLITTLHLLKLSGIERWLERLLAPVLRWVGISRHALSMSLIGVTLGLAYGGGLLIREAQKGHLQPHEVFSAMTLLGLCHSLIEDTLLIALTGADFSGILWARLGWALLLIALISRLIARLPRPITDRWLVRSVAANR